MAVKSIWNHQKDLTSAEGQIYEEMIHKEFLLSEEEKEKEKERERERRVCEEIFKYQQGLLARGEGG